MPILDVQRRGQQIGRIRIGEQVSTGKQDKNGRDKMRPSRLSTFRFTTASRVSADAIAALYGGTVRPWESQYEVITKESAIGVTVPPRDQVVSQWYEMWTAAGCARRCTSQQQVNGEACLCPHAKDPGDEDEVSRCALERANLAKLNPPKACKLITRISVMIPDLPGLGVFRLDTHSFYAASEIGDAAALLQVARDKGIFLPAMLRIEQRSRVANGETKKYPVPVLEILATFREIASGALEAGGITAQLPPAPGEQPKAITSGRPADSGPRRQEQMPAGVDRPREADRPDLPERCDDLGCTEHPGDDPQGSHQVPEGEPWEQATVIYQRALAGRDRARAGLRHRGEGPRAGRGVRLRRPGQRRMGAAAAAAAGTVAREGRCSVSHPLAGTIPAAKCPECGHWARPDEVTECRHCDCKHHRASPYQGHDPQTPPGAESALAAFMKALFDAQQALEQAANEEVDAEMDLEERRRELMLSDDCPRAAGPGRTATVAYQNAWIDQQVADLIRTHRIARARREAAEKVLKVLERNSSLQQSISRSVGQSYLGQREPGW